MDFLAREKKRTTALQSPGRAAREMGGSREASRTAVAGNHCKRRAPRGRVAGVQASDAGECPYSRGA